LFEVSFIQPSQRVNLKKSLYDSYIKAFRWASDRITEGIIGFVTNANWLNKDAMSGLRKCFAKEFSEIYVFNLRGDIRNKEKSDTTRNQIKKVLC